MYKVHFIGLISGL